MKTQIKINDRLTIVIDPKADIKDGDWFYNQWSEEGKKVDNNSTSTGRKIANRIKTHYKIVATIGSERIKGIPILNPSTMKTYILTAELKVTDETIRKALQWQKRKNLNYGDDMAHLLFDCIADGEDIGYEIEKTELDDFKETENGFKKLLADIKS